MLLPTPINLLFSLTLAYPCCSAAPMSVMYVFNVTVGMVGLQLVNVPMFFAIRQVVEALVI